MGDAAETANTPASRDATRNERGAVQIQLTPSVHYTTLARVKDLPVVHTLGCSPQKESNAIETPTPTLPKWQWRSCPHTRWGRTSIAHAARHRRRNPRPHV